MAYFALGRKAESDEALAQMLKRQANHPYFIAQVYAFRGETDEALKWLDRAYAQRDASLAITQEPGKFMKTRRRSAIQGVPAQDEPARGVITW